MTYGANNARRLALVSPVLAAAWMEISQRFAAEFRGCMLGVAQGFRMTRDQMAANAAGRSKANGTTTFSYHQHLPSLALDFSVLDPTTPDGYVTDGMDARYRWVGQLFVARGFEWGGDWHDPDWDHVNIQAPAPDFSSVEASEAAYVELMEQSPYLRV